MIDKLQSLSGRALDLVGQAGDGLKHMVPNGAGKWLETGAALGALKTGAALGALKTGSRVATTLVRRHPAAAVATVAGAGLLWYLARRRARQAEHAPIEGSATRIEASVAAAATAPVRRASARRPSAPVAAARKRRRPEALARNLGCGAPAAPLAGAHRLPATR